MEDKFGTGADKEEIKTGLEDLKDFVLENDKFNKEPFGDECADFVKDVTETLDGNKDTCLLKDNVKKFVGCVSSGFREYENCHEIPVDTDDGEVEACSWKGSMNKAWDIAKNIRCG